MSTMENGGEIFLNRLTEPNTFPPSFLIFTAEDLSLATENYSETRIIGPGSNADSILYKGFLPPTNTAVAIKKWISFSETHINRFTNELIALSNLPPGKHIVRIIGAGCDETPVPVVVYEYMPRGTLQHHVHDLGGSRLSWESRLRIMAGIAEALWWLQAAIPNPQFHRGVKARDVLFDEGMVAKMSDFGGRLMMEGCFTFLRIGKDREGYLEPEFGSLGVEGDVYGFGVVMAEMLTGEKAASELGKRFREGGWWEMVEGRVKEEGEGRVVEAVAGVARRCLAVRGEERPRMREVAEELRSLIGGEKDGAAS